MSTNLDDMLKEAPALTLEPFEAQTKSLPAESPVQIIEETQTKVPEVVLTPEEQKMVDDFAAQIDITNTQMVMQ